MLKTGDNGRAVLQLQRDLTAAGFNPGPPDGEFGPKTKTAVLNLQRSCRITADGIYGPVSQKALKLLIPHLPGGQLSEHFSEAEFACRCCGKVRVNMFLINMLEKLRAELGGRPIAITSGFRCAKHNKQVGGAAASRHLTGSAADIVVSGTDPDAAAAAAEKLGFTGVGRYRTFTHVDVRQTAPARWYG